MPQRLCCRVLRRRRPLSFRPWRKVNSKKRRGLSAALAEGAEEQHLRHAGTGDCARIFCCWRLSEPPLRPLAIAARRRPIRSNGHWFRPIKTIRRSTHNARRCVRSTRMCRRRCQAIGPTQCHCIWRLQLLPRAQQIRQPTSVSKHCYLQQPRRVARYPAIRRDRDPNAFQRISNRQSHAASGKARSRARARRCASPSS